MIKPNTQIEPLIEDVGKYLNGKFLVSTSYKRWLVANKLKTLWDQCVQIAEEDRSYVYLGSSMAETDAHTALSILLSHFFEKNKKTLVHFLCETLKLYANENDVRLDVSDIRSDLFAAGISEDIVSEINECETSADIDDAGGDEIAFTPELEVRHLEETYKILLSEPNSRKAIEAYLEWHMKALLYLSDFFTDLNADFKEFKDLDNSGNGYALKSNFHSIYAKYNLMMTKTSQRSENVLNRKHSPMVFISHSSKDKEFAEALVDLLESVGLDKNTLFCSSVDGYGLGLSDDIFDTLRSLFEEHELYVIFLHSPRYYQSPVSLNEMGAAWVLKTDFCSILTRDMQFDHMAGVVNGSKISIKVDASDAESRLNQLFEKINELFNLIPLDVTKWERKRKTFLKSVNSIDYAVDSDMPHDLSVDSEYKQLMIEKMKAESDDRKKAVIKGNIVKGLKSGERTLYIFNAGAAAARDIHVEWLNPSDQVVVYGDFTSIEDLTPQSKRTFSMLICLGSPEVMKLRFSWKDEFSDKNVIVENVQI